MNLPNHLGDTPGNSCKRLPKGRNSSLPPSLLPLFLFLSGHFPGALASSPIKKRKETVSLTRKTSDSTHRRPSVPTRNHQNSNIGKTRGINQYEKPAETIKPSVLHAGHLKEKQKIIPPFLLFPDSIKIRRYSLHARRLRRSAIRRKFFMTGNRWRLLKGCGGGFPVVTIIKR